MTLSDTCETTTYSDVVFQMLSLLPGKQLFLDFLGRMASLQACICPCVLANQATDREPAFWVDYGTNT